MTPDYNWWDKIILLLSETWKPGTFNQVYLTYYMIAVNWSKCACSVPQSCRTLCDPMDHSPPGSSVPGILQAWILDWVAMPSSRGSSQGLNLHLLGLLHWQVDSWLLASPVLHLWPWISQARYWSGLPWPPGGYLPDLGIKPASPQNWSKKWASWFSF